VVAVPTLAFASLGRQVRAAKSANVYVRRIRLPPTPSYAASYARASSVTSPARNLPKRLGCPCRASIRSATGDGSRQVQVFQILKASVD
jgi:hypothetical protein